jgi:hypothetical protein
MRLLSLTLLFIAFTAFTSGPGGDEQSALQRYKAASKAQEDALADLEKAYAHAEGALAAFRAAEAGKSPTAAERLASITAALVAQQQERPPPADAKEARARRRADLDELGRAIRSELSARGLADDTLLDALGDLIAHEATAKPGKEDLATRCAQVLSRWLATGRGCELLWNDSLYARSEAAKSFKSKYDDYMAAGVELDRVRHPEFYLPGGAKTRPNMVYVPGGSYTVGPDNGFDRKKKNVTLRPFLLDRCEVSNADYVAFLDSLPAEQREAHTPRHWTAEGGTGPAPPPRRQARPPGGRRHVARRRRLREVREQAPPHGRRMGGRVPREGRALLSVGRPVREGQVQRRGRRARDDRARHGVRGGRVALQGAQHGGQRPGVDLLARGGRHDPRPPLEHRARHRARRPLPEPRRERRREVPLGRAGRLVARALPRLPLRGGPQVIGAERGSGGARAPRQAFVDPAAAVARGRFAIAGRTVARATRR